jgi:hypothetical protein
LMRVAVLTCPYCGAKANFTMRHHWDEALPTGATARYGAWVCDACHQPVVGEPAPSGEPVRYYPQRVAEPSLPDVPDDVAADAREAHRCFSVGAHRAAVVMARRAMQSAALENGAPDQPLVEQIDWLEGQRLITPQMREVAHAIRLAGNVGAHPDRDGLRDVGEPDAQAVIEFLDDFLKYVYEIPARLQRLTGST